MKKLILIVMSVFMLTGCAGTYYSHKKIPVKLNKATAKLYGDIDDLELSIDIERCWSSTDECSKILNHCKCEEK